MVGPQLLPQVSVGPGWWAATLWWHSALALHWALHAEALHELNDQEVDFSLLQQLSAKLPQLPEVSSVPAHCRIGWACQHHRHHLRQETHSLRLSKILSMKATSLNNPQLAEERTSICCCWPGNLAMGAVTPICPCWPCAIMVGLRDVQASFHRITGKGRPRCSARA